MGNPDLQKMDIGLATAVRAYQENLDKSNENDGISVTLQYEGDLGSIEALGFETHMVMGDEALGVVRFKDIEKFIAHPGVIWMAAGQPREPDLDTAVTDMRVRASTAANLGSDGLWHIPNTGGALNQVGDATGSGVIVAIIDTGIDFTHPMFLSQLTPTKKTRIKRIWDQGLTPVSVADCPDVALLASSETYGVEFTDTEIDSALAGGAPVEHKDCDGHGTHVAGIAAGGVLFPSGGNAKVVGVAPEADIIVVKYLDNPHPIQFIGSGNVVSETARFRDAVLYCLRTARTPPLDKPIVINMSFGSRSEPGDGLDRDSLFVDQIMDPATAAGSENFPKGAIIVKSAGNDGDISKRQTARIEIPAAGEITVPFELEDNKGTANTKWKQCNRLLHQPSIIVDFWYRHPTVGPPVEFAMRLPHQAAFRPDVGAGVINEIGFKALAGPPPREFVVAASSDVHRAGINHEANAAVSHPAGTVHRCHVQFFVKPKEKSGDVLYHPAIYEVRIKAPAGTVIFAMCKRESWGSGQGVVFKVAEKMQNGSGLHPNIKVTEESSATDTLGQHVITVASYDDTDGKAANPKHHHIAASSSRGPLRDFSDPASPLPVIAVKPDIAGPGVRIRSAEGLHTESMLPLDMRIPTWRSGIRFINKSGTSMAAPTIAGLIALMLDKKKDLNVTDVRTALFTAPRPAVDPSTAPQSTQAYGIGMVDALSTHNNT